MDFQHKDCGVYNVVYCFSLWGLGKRIEKGVHVGQLREDFCVIDLQLS